MGYFRSNRDVTKYFWATHLTNVTLIVEIIAE